MLFNRNALSASATGLGIVLAPVASAQVATAPAPAPAEKASTASIQPDASQGIGDIIVTASRRSDTVQKSALAITALSGDLLARQGVSQPEDLNKLATGLTISKNGASTQVFLRGVGSFAVSSYADSAVAFSVDGVFYGFPTAVAGSFYDLQRIEVLKGPQGTLYGRNATAGAINLIPNHPTFDTNGTMSVDVGNYGLFKVDGAINIALSDTLAVRASGYRTRRGGYFSDGYGNDVSEAGRLQALFRPTDSLSVLLAGEYSYVGGARARRSFPSPRPEAIRGKGHRPRRRIATFRPCATLAYRFRWPRTMASSASKPITRELRSTGISASPI